MAQPVQKQSRVWVWVIVALAAAIAIYVWYRAAQPAAVVAAVGVTREDITRTVSTNGQVQPTEDFQAHAAAPGMVSQLLVKVGQTVSRGQQLIELDAGDARERVATAQASLAGDELALKNMQGGGSTADLMVQRNDLANAELQEHQAAATLTTIQKLQAQGAASANEVAAAQQKVTEAQLRISQLKSMRSGKFGASDLAAQRALVAQAQAGLSAAESAYSGVDIRAPFAGTVYSVAVTQYEAVPAGALLLDLADLTKLQVKAYFDEPEIGRLAAGQPVTIVWDAKPNSTWHGHILQAPTTITTYGTRNVGECLITVDDANGDLLPNTNVTVTVTTQQEKQVLSLPREALHTEGTSDFVYKIVNGALVKTPVTVGVVNLVQFEIVSGLKEGDVVALHATNETELKNGLHVQAQL